MKTKWRWWLAGMAVCVTLAGCEKPEMEPDMELAAQRRQDMAAPVVSGPHGDIAVKGKREDLVKAVRDVFAESKVHITEMGEPGAGKWFLGKSLANRKVLVEITPLLPERWIVRTTVEGGDQLTQELLDHVSQEISRRMR